MEYPDVSRIQYNRWKQSANLTTTLYELDSGVEKVDGYTAINNDWTDVHWGGLSKSTSSSTFIDGSPGTTGWYYSIGNYAFWRGGLPGPNILAYSVDLWVRIDDKTTTNKASITAKVGGLFENKTYYLWVKDALGNTNSQSFNITKVDDDVLTAPSVSGGGTGWSQSKTFTLTPPSSTSGIGKYEYYISDSTTAPGYDTAPTGFSTSASITIKTTGQYIYFRAVNNVGTKSAWTTVKNLYVDAETPIIKSISGASTTWSSSARAFTLTNNTATSGISSAYYYVSSSTTAPSATTTGTKCTSATSCSVGTGKYVFFRIVNGAGTSSDWSKYRNNYVDTTTPTITLNSSIPASITKGTSYTIISSYTANGPSSGSASCSSNYDGTITNTSKLTTLQKHTITCTVTTGAGKTASKSFDLTITYTKYTVKNLIGDPSFESSGSGWKYITGTISSSYANSGSKSLYCNDTSTTTSCWNVYDVTIDKNDVIYLRAATRYVTGSNDGNNYAGNMAISADGTNIGVRLTFDASVKNSFVVSSSVTTASAAGTQFQIGVSVATTGTAYYDDLVAVNLTDVFGAGNEPDKDWCDANIGYFSGSKTIYK